MRFKDGLLSQLQDFQKWSATGAQAGDVSLLDYVGFIGTLDTLVAYAELFFPELVIHDNSRFLASGFSTELYATWAAKGLSSREIQRVMNHVHISTLMQHQYVSDEAAVECARILADLWNRTLGSEGLVAEALGTDLADAAVTFCEA